MSKQALKTLRELVRCTHEFGDGCGPRKLGLLRTLHAHRLPQAPDILKLHESLCFLRAYPDDVDLLAQVERMLAEFGERGDVRRNREELANSGVAGAPIYFQFYAESALRLARRWGAHLSIDWEQFERSEKIEALLPLLTLYCETPALDEYAFGVQEWIERLKGAGETDAEFLLRRIERMAMSSHARETILDELDIPLCLSPGPDTPSRSREHYLEPGAASKGVAYQTRPLARNRPSITEISERRTVARHLPIAEARKVIDLARSAMAVRNRDLDAFAYATEHDVRVVDCEPGLQMALIGVAPERRLMLETLYGYLVLRNGVPVGYGTITALFNSAEVAYTIFDTFRSAEAASIFGWVLTITRRLFDADTMMIDPYQIGKDNDDAIQSGAWWFYQKLGFAPRDPGAFRIMRRELKRMKSRRSHRSSAATLKQLAEHNVFLTFGDQRDDALGVLPLANVGLQTSRFLADNFGADREKAARTCAKEARALLGVRAATRFSPGERLAWDRWGPLVMTLRGVARWPQKAKRSLADAIRAKGGKRESDYLFRFDSHRRLRTALRKLAETNDDL